jgi:hypothetical protein
VENDTHKDMRKEKYKFYFPSLDKEGIKGWFDMV